LAHKPKVVGIYRLIMKAGALRVFKGLWSVSRPRELR
jgi:CHAT domain-containing protein